ncbi:MAG: hypothetical protein AB1635_13480 [Acidobacteriota bacterium]
MTLAEILPWFLFVLGIGFLVANIRVGLELLGWLRRRATTLVVWLPPKPPFYGLSLALGVMLGLLLFVTLAVARRPGLSAFGELMMFVYYGYALPLSTRIGRGLYEDGIWADSGFVPYTHIGGITWKEGENPTLVVVSRQQHRARSLEVPGHRLGEVRRLLREKIASHTIETDLGPGLHLGERDGRDSV